MNKYNNSKIYKIASHLGDKIYIGSTYRTIEERFKDHQSKYSFYNIETHITSSILFDKYGINNCTVELLEQVNVDTRSELLQIEAEHIKANRINCVNKNLPFLCNEERVKNYKQYRKNNKYNIRCYQEEYRNKHRIVKIKDIDALELEFIELLK